MKVSHHEGSRQSQRRRCHRRLTYCIVGGGQCQQRLGHLRCITHRATNNICAHANPDKDSSADSLAESREVVALMRVPWRSGELTRPRSSISLAAASVPAVDPLPSRGS